MCLARGCFWARRRRLAWAWRLLLARRLLLAGDSLPSFEGHYYPAGAVVGAGVARASEVGAATGGDARPGVTPGGY